MRSVLLPVLALFALPGLASDGPAPTPPKFDGSDFDAGTILPGAVIRHTYTITNSGATPLTLAAVKPSCGCTTSDYTRDPIAPGGVGQVTLEVHPNGPGEFVKSAVVLLTNPAESSLTLTVHFKVVQWVTADPDRIFLPAAAAFEPADFPPITIKVTQSDKAMASPSVTDLPIGTRAVLTPVTAGKEYRLDFKIDPGHKPGETLDGHLTLNTGIADQPKFVLPVTIAFRGKVQLTPDRLVWGEIPIAQLKSGPENYRMRLLIDYPGHGRRPLKLGKPVSSARAVVVETIEELVPGRRYALRVALDPATAAGEVRSTITLPTSEPTMRTIEIPIVATIR